MPAATRPRKFRIVAAATRCKIALTSSATSSPTNMRPVKPSVVSRGQRTLVPGQDAGSPSGGADRVPGGVIDHLARARLGSEQGWGMFEHASMGRHDPSGFKDWSSVAP